MQNTLTPVTETVIDEAVVDDFVSPKLGTWQASCGPHEHGMSEYPIAGILTFLGGCGLIAMPYFVEGNTPQDTEGAKFFFGILGGFCVLIGAALMLMLVLTKEQIIHLFEGGLAREVDGKIKELSWDEIKDVKICEFYESRNAQQKFNVFVTAKKSGSFKFSSHYEGDPNKLINAIKGKVEKLKCVPFTP